MTTPDDRTPGDRTPGEHVAVAVIGAGPAGLTAATALARSVHGEVRVIEREEQAGGIPRHSDHTGYGLRDLRRVLTGPRYARRLTATAQEAGAVLHTGAMVTGWAGEHTLEVTSPRGRQHLHADAIILATGARERPRAARRIPGDRGAGVYTTGQLQNLVHLHHATVGRPVGTSAVGTSPVGTSAVGTRAVVIGAELVSWSAVLTLREAGCRTVLMTTARPRPESYAAVTALGRYALRVPVATATRVVRINGTARVESVDIENLTTGARRTVACDTVITTGDWIPDNELARSAGLDLDPATLGPTVDTALRTSRPGVFAAGNLLHPVDTADVAALDGRHVAAQVTRWLADRATPDPGVRILAQHPLRWITPQILRPTDPAPARGRLLAWLDAHLPTPTVRTSQNGRVLASRRLPWAAAPGRVFRIPADLVDDAHPDAGPVTVTVHAGRWPARSG